MNDELFGRNTTEEERYTFVQNTACEFFPCHDVETKEKFNCLFCFCPLIQYADCGGKYTIQENGVKDCSACLLPHEDYDKIIDKLREKQPYLAKNLVRVEKPKLQG